MAPSCHRITFAGMKLLVAVFVACGLACAGCATSGSVDRHPIGPATYALGAVHLHGPRGTELSASREWGRDTTRAVALADEAVLRDAFVRQLERAVRFDPESPLRLRTTLTLEGAGFLEGLSAETADVTLVAEIVDGHDAILRTVTLRESASAPLQRSASRKERLEAAFDRLALRLAHRLESVSLPTGPTGNQP